MGVTTEEKKHKKVTSATSASIPVRRFSLSISWKDYAMHEGAAKPHPSYWVTSNPFSPLLSPANRSVL